MKITTNICIEKQGKAARFYDKSAIYLRFTYCQYEEFSEWLENNSQRIQTICAKYGWTYDVGHGDLVIYFSKN